MMHCRRNRPESYETSSMLVTDPIPSTIYRAIRSRVSCDTVHQEMYRTIHHHNSNCEYMCLCVSLWGLYASVYISTLTSESLCECVGLDASLWISVPVYWSVCESPFTRPRPPTFRTPGSASITRGSAKPGFKPRKRSRQDGFWWIGVSDMAVCELPKLFGQPLSSLRSLQCH